MRCSKCFSPVSLKNGVMVCTVCGQEAELRTDDGQIAEFEDRRPGLTPGVRRAGIIVLALATLLAAGWGGYVYARPWLDGQKSEPEIVRQDAPSVIQDLSVLSPEVREHVITAFGATDADMALGLAVREEGKVTVLTSANAPGARLTLAETTEEGRLKRRPLGARGVQASGALQSSWDGTGYVLAKDIGTFELIRIDQTNAPIWSHPSTYKPGSPAEFTVSNAGAAIVSRSDTSEALKAALFSPDGEQVWQRSFFVGRETAYAAYLSDTGGLSLVIQSLSSLQTRLVQIDRFGQVAREVLLQAVEAPISQVLVSGQNDLVLLTKGPVPELHVFAPSGERKWSRPMTEAVLSDAIFLRRASADQISIAWSYQLSDVQTDFSLVNVSQDGTRQSQTNWTLPAGSNLKDLQLGTSGSLIALIEAPLTNEMADVLLLSLRPAAPLETVLQDEPETETQAEPELAIEPEPITEEPVVAPSKELPVAAAPAAPSPKPEAAPAEEQETELEEDASEPDAEEALPPIQCRFVCLIDGEPFGSWSEIDPGTADFADGSPKAYARICNKLGGLPSGEAPRCR